MKANRKLLWAAVAIGFSSTAGAVIVDLGNPYNVYQTYGNVNVYSLPYNALTYNDATGSTGTGPGTPYYIPSTPGAIKEQVVIYTGSSGTGVMENAAGFEDAYGAPNGTVPYASTDGMGVSSSPSIKAEINNSLATTWDADLLALKGFLGGGDAVFLFNNNDENKDQNLAIWAKIWITDPGNVLYGNYLYLSNMGNTYGWQAPVGGDAAAYNGGNIASPLVDPDTKATDYVMSGGNVCFNSALQPEACTNTSEYTINHNLGANQVAYAGMIPVLDGYFDTLFALGNDILTDYTLHIELRLGCDDGWLDRCDDLMIDNGFEQLWLTSTTTDIPVPEPAMLSLTGLALLMLAGSRQRRQKLVR